MSDHITLRGYAVPFGRRVLLAATGNYERFDRHAFDGFLARRPAVAVQWADHSNDAPRLGSTTSGTAGLFADSYGLGFWVRLDMRSRNGRLSDHWSRIRQITQRGNAADRCSIGGLHIDREVIEKHLGNLCRSVMSARIDHITITADAAYRDLTGVWPDHCDIADAPWRIQTMAQTWQAGHAAWNARPKLLLSTRAVAKVVSPRRGGGMNLLAFAALKPRHAHYATVRKLYARAVMNRRPEGGVILAHAAFTAEAGFDGNWDRLFDDARG
jgi:phage head maturation protease